MKTVQVIVSGKVQHVGFRACTKRIAASLGIGGMVQNRTDGRVEITATADQAVLDKFVAMIYSCPRVVVREIEVKTVLPQEFPDFCILREIRQ